MTVFGNAPGGTSWLGTQADKVFWDDGILAVDKNEVFGSGKDPVQGLGIQTTETDGANDANAGRLVARYGHVCWTMDGCAL